MRFVIYHNSTDEFAKMIVVAFRQNFMFMNRHTKFIKTKYSNEHKQYETMMFKAWRI